MQVHGPDSTVKQIDVGEYHSGAVNIYVGPFRIVTYTAEDCDMLIAAACLAKQRHEGMLNPGRDLLRARLAALAMPDCDDAAEFSHIAIEGTA